MGRAKSNQVLFLFTAGYPYGTRQESFLENEIAFLAESFDEVVVFPRTKETGVRKVPENVRVNDLYVNLEAKRKILILLRNLSFAIRVLRLSNPSIKDVLHFFKYPRIYLDILASGIHEGETLVDNLSEELRTSNVVFYDYWFINSIISIDYLRTKRKLDNKFICRGHRYDIYDGNWPTNRVPFFTYRMQVVDELVLISKDGYDYIHARCSSSQTNKLRLSYLGVQPQPVRPEKTNSTFRIVSCARVVDFKNVHQTPLLFENLEVNIDWVHFGDGPLMETLEERCKDLQKNINVRLMGHQSNEDVLKYYRKNHVDLFVSLSDSEGLPVSMMEAQSFGIPIFAKDVGGVSEIVNNVTGCLVPKDMRQIEMQLLIKDIVKHHSFDRNEIIKFFDSNFNANKNYSDFAKKLIDS